MFEVTPQDVTGNLNDKVRLECRVASNPEPTYKWQFNDHYQSSGPFLEFDLSNKTAGAYSCEASVPGFPSVSQSARVRLRGPPRILMEHGTQFRYKIIRIRDPE